MTLLLTVIAIALIFEYINGFHDTANSIATVVSTKVLTPRQAVMMAAFFNLVGALVGTAVAKTIASGLVDAHFATTQAIICALFGAIVWNLVTWYFGLPSSSSHALVGGLCGAVLAASGNNWDALVWAKTGADVWYQNSGLLFKVVIPMVLSPLIGMMLGFLIMGALYGLLRNWRPILVNSVFGKLQIASAAFMGFSHGNNDAQKTMGIIFLALAGGAAAGQLDKLPDWASWLYQPPESAAVGKAHLRLAEYYIGSDDGKPVDLHRAMAEIDKAAKAKEKGYSLLRYRVQTHPEAGKLADRSGAIKSLEAGTKAGVQQSAIEYASVLEQGRLGLAPNGNKAYEIGESAKAMQPVDPLAFAWPRCAKESPLFKDSLPHEGKDPAATARWLEDFLEKQRNAPAQVMLGILYAEGRGVAKDAAKARRLFEEAATRPDLDALYNLGVLELRAGNREQAKADFEKLLNRESIPVWIKVACALTMAAGTAAGGWRIIKTMGHKMVKLQPVHGFAAETAAASVIITAGNYGMPISTTHAITTSIMGVGSAKRLNAIKWKVVERIIWAWILTLPVSAAIAWLSMNLWQLWS